MVCTLVIRSRGAREKNSDRPSIIHLPRLLGMAPFSHRVIVSTLAVLIGSYVVYDNSRDLQLVSYKPFSEEEVARRKREGASMTMKTLDSCTLDYTPEAKEKFRKMEAENSKTLKEKSDHA